MACKWLYSVAVQIGCVRIVSVSVRPAFVVAGVVAVVLTSSGLPAASDPSATPEVEAAEPAESADPDATLKPGQIVTVAGSGATGYSGDGGAALDARLNDWLRISVGSDGRLYIADTFNKRLREVDPDGTIDTVAGTRAQRSPETDGPEVPGWGFWSPSNAPRASAVAPDGSLYVAADQDIRRIDPAGATTVIAGAGESDVDETGVDGGLAVDASIYKPEDIDVDDAGNVYVADTNGNRVRKIDTAGVITTVAGGGELSLSDSEGLAATGADTYGPTSVAVDSEGNVYFTVELGGGVFKVDPAGILTRVTGSAVGPDGDGGPAVEAGLTETDGRSLAVDDEDNLYICDGDRVRMVDSDGIITTIGPRMPLVDDIAVGAEGDLYFASGSEVSMLVRSADPVADDGEAAADGSGAGPSAWAGDEPGTVVDVAGAAFDPDAEPEPVRPVELDVAAGPQSVAVDAAGALYYADTERHVVNKVDPDGSIATFAGTGEAEFAGDGGPAVEASLNSPRGVVVDAAGTVYVADSGNARVRRIDAAGVISTVAGTTPPDDAEVANGDGGPATEAILSAVSDVALGPDGSLYLADPGHGCIRKVDPAGIISTVAGGGDLWAKDGDNAPATEASLWEPGAVDVDAAGNVYFLENGNPYVRMVRTDGVLVTVAGDSYFRDDEGGFAGDGGPAVAAELNTPTDVEVGPDGTVYVADTYNSRIRAIDPGGVITTVAGTGEPYDTGDGGPALEAAVNEPVALTLDAEGTVYLTGPRGDAIRAIAADGTIRTVAVIETSGTDGPGGTGGTGGVPALEAALGNLTGVAVGPDGRFHVASIQGVDTVDADGTIRPFGAPEQPLAGATVVTATDAGDIYAVIADEVVRVYPDGDVVTVAGGGTEEAKAEDGRNALTATLSATDLAAGPDGVLYIADMTQKRVFTVAADGTLAERADLTDLSSVGGIAVGSDGTVYVADHDGDKVYAVDGDGEVSPVAGTGESTVYNDDLGDGGPATEAVVSSPVDVAVDGDGTLYVSEYYGIRRISDGTIDSVLDAFRESDVDGEADTTLYNPKALVFGPGGDLYFADTHTEQVRVLVRPGEIAGPFPWLWVGLGGGAVVLAAVVLLVLRRRKTGDTAGATVSGAGSVRV